MDIFQKFSLSDEDIEIGIDDFFTELLIDATRQIVGRVRSLSELASPQPKIVFTVGQPGSGKTTLGKYIKSKYSEMGECIVEESSDKIAKYHRDYNELLKLLPDDCYKLTRQFVRPAEPKIYGKIRENKISIIQEKSLNRSENDYEFLQKFIDAGYNTEINIMAVDKYESFLSCIERDISLIELGQEPRPVSRINHDRMYEPMLDEIREIIARGHNSVIASKDPTAHAEVNTIRKAAQNLGTHDLSDCVLYVNAEPCPMCLSAIIWANIKEVYFANTAEEAGEIGFRDDMIYDFIKSGNNDKNIMNITHVESDEAKKVFEEFKNNNERIMY